MITEFFLKLPAGCKCTHFVDKIQTILLVDELYVTGPSQGLKIRGEGAGECAPLAQIR